MYKVASALKIIICFTKPLITIKTYPWGFLRQNYSSSESLSLAKIKLIKHKSTLTSKYFILFIINIVCDQNMQKSRIDLVH